MTARILVGTASWTDHDPFYPPGVTGADRLVWYAEHFPYVEIDSSYYHIPPARVTAGWAARTPDGFMMDIKAHRTMTLHERQAGKPVPPSEEDLRWFEFALNPLREAGKLGAILYQWPPWFTATPASFDELARVRERHPDDRVAIEFRHRSWGEPETWERVTDLLSEAKLTYCCVDEPQIGSGTMTPVVAATTPELAIIRLHGRNARTWYKRVEKTGQRFDWWYAEEELDEIAKSVRDLAEAAAEVHVSVNTNGYNQGPVNALKLAGVLDLPQADPRLLAELLASTATGDSKATT